MKNARLKSFVLIASLLLTLVGAWAMSGRALHPAVLNRPDSSSPNAAGLKSTKTTLTPPAAPPPTISVDSVVIAGGGGVSTGNTNSGSNVEVEGTIAQTAAGAASTSSNGQFSVSGGYWQAEATPTPTPSPSPGPS